MRDERAAGSLFQSQQYWEGQRKDLNRALTLEAASGLGGCGGDARPTFPLLLLEGALTFSCQESTRVLQQPRMRKAHATVTVLVIEG